MADWQEYELDNQGSLIESQTSLSELGFVTPNTGSVYEPEQHNTSNVVVMNREDKSDCNISSLSSRSSAQSTPKHVDRSVEIPVDTLQKLVHTQPQEVHMNRHFIINIKDVSNDMNDDVAVDMGSRFTRRTRRYNPCSTIRSMYERTRDTILRCYGLHDE
jgi:hypothetical protein